MGANSLPRRLVKRLLAPVLNEATYSVLQAVAMGWDIKSGGWYEPELELLTLGLREGETAIDVGANYGLYAYHMSRAVGPRGKVYCFEPVPFTARTFRLIQRALRFRHNVELVNAGCAEKSGRVTFTVPVNDTGAISAGLVHMGRNDEREGNDRVQSFRTKTIECDVVSLDEHLAGVDRVALVKCDIEGADLFAMRGARGLLEKHHPTVIIEITPWYLEGFGLTVADVTQFFGGLGYRCYRYVDGTLIASNEDSIEEDNWVFVHPSRRDRFARILPAEC
jgi:FkbM family methyltransferase